mmetsp:Transcript_13959/g.38251  ORF Transcript_13959/g.38251 Transcript_13959/m.38251 type:complete len:84 (+) Transcript_13959:94-345(+)
MFSLLRLMKLANLGTDDYPSGLSREESFQSDEDEATFINTPNGYFIPPGCTNGFYYREEYGGQITNTKVCYNSKSVSSVESPA